LPAADGAQADQGLALVPVSDLTIKDTWDMAGMRGTGSNTLLGARVFVPDYRLRSFAGILAGRGGTAPGPLYTVPVGSLIVTLMGPLLGIGREVFRMTMETVESGKPLTASVYRSLADSPSVQAALANAATLIDSAHLHLARSAEFVGAEAEAGRTPGLVERARARMDIGYASACLREAVQLLLTVNGAGSFARANVIQRYWRDLETAARHPSLNPELAKEMYGRALVGNQQPVSHML
jgi:alkylation response protein AidB-like acyl-CoA dehydrogenase